MDDDEFSDVTVLPEYVNSAAQASKDTRLHRLRHRAESLLKSLKGREEFVPGECDAVLLAYEVLGYLNLISKE